jgi:hypothetical protein
VEHLPNGNKVLESALILSGVQGSLGVLLSTFPVSQPSVSLSFFPLRLCVSARVSAALSRAFLHLGAILILYLGATARASFRGRTPK